MGKATIIAIGLTPAIFLITGLVIGYNSHPYEQCSRQYVGGDDIGECVYLKKQGE